MSFRIHPLPMAPFARFFDMGAADLRAHRARIETVTACPGSPCRVSLEDAAVGERVLLIHHTHLDGDSPFRASHAIYVREGAQEFDAPPGTLPEALLRRPMSLRGFDAEHMMVAAELADGTAVGPKIEHMLDDPKVAFVHLHYAKPGCYAARATRA